MLSTVSATEPLRPKLSPAPTPRINLFGISIDVIRQSQAVAQILDWIDRPDGCRYIVTPNVDHIVKLRCHQQLQIAYRDASLVLADGAPVVAASRLLGKSLPERVTGSDLVPALFDSGRPLRVYLLGARPGVAQRAGREIESRWPNVRVVGCYAPPQGFEVDGQQNEWALARIRNCRPDVLLVGLGAPKQELWVHLHRDAIRASVALCVGATIDFLAGEKARAPRWMRRHGLEWLHRLASEPKRLASRYLKDAIVFPWLVLREVWRTR